ncbi:winged helix-turn-helix transcriptional regulator [Actinacidiphila yeochonensis]|uniref:winged helix-turn-helix transcriptional regulator n=1 Tax=Actinacidiphila yeochonensis TaxID=89050 RepID=UPI00068E7AA3|nr:helix-turn-helix domain-containing protein [Actinacidiphila yeochonensis]
MARRSYDQYCAVARALDTVGDRWTLLVVRELLAGPRRYTDLHADLPGVSTDMLATRLRDLERDGLLERRRLPAPASVQVYELTARGRRLTPVLTALAAFGADGLGEPRPTDAVRAHWFAVPLIGVLERLDGLPDGVLEVRVDESGFHLVRSGGEFSYADGPAPAADARLALTADVCVELIQGRRPPAELLADGAAVLAGDGALARALRARPADRRPVPAGG